MLFSKSSINSSSRSSSNKKNPTAAAVATSRATASRLSPFFLDSLCPVLLCDDGVLPPAEPLVHDPLRGAQEGRVQVGGGVVLSRLGNSEGGRVLIVAKAVLA